MQRAMAHYVPREMAVLGLVELILSFAATYVILQTGGTPAWMAECLGGLPGTSAAPAAMLAFAISLIALPIGLYQPEVCLDRRRLLPAACLAAVLVFAALLLFGRTDGRFTIGHALETARLSVAGLAIMTLVRLAWGLDLVRNRLVRPVLVLGGPAEAATFAARLDSRRGRNFKPVAVQDGDASWQALRRRRIWGVVLASGIEPRMAELDA